MHLKKINELAVILEKVNYLYRNIRKSNDAPKKIELALLKRYVTDFYDGLVELDVPAGTFSIPTADHQTSTEASVEKQVSKVVEKQPIVAVTETSNTSEEEKEAPWVATMSEKFTSIKESVAEKVETAKEVVSEKMNNLSEELPSWKEKAKDIKDNISEKLVSLKEDASEKIDDATEHLPSWKEKAANLLETAKEKAEDLKENVSEKINNLTHKKDNDDTDKPPIFERMKDSLSHEYREENDESVRTMVLENKSASGSIKITHETDDETLAIDAKKAAPLIEALKSGKSAESGGSGSGKNIFPINFNQRYAFVNRLFDGDEAAYGKAINDLSESKGYIEALTYVNLNLRYDYKWRDDDPTVKEFLEIIKHTFLD